MIAFGVVIVYHIECFYSGDWLINSEHIVPAVDALMLVTHPWRTALLFVVAGASFRLMQRRAPSALLGRQIVRLGAPLLVGMALLVPPQIIVAQAANGADWSVANWLAILARGNLEHLWFIAYLLAYTIILAPLVRFFSPALDRMARTLNGWGLMTWPLALLALLRCAVFPAFGETHDIATDWYVHGISLAAFVFGYVLAGAPALWATLVARRAAFFACAILGYAGVAAGAPAHALFYAMLQWGAIAAVLGYCAKLLSRESRIIRYLNCGVLPAFLVHQPIIVVLGYYLKPYALPLVLEASLLLAATILGSLLAYEASRALGPRRRGASPGIAKPNLAMAHSA